MLHVPRAVPSPLRRRCIPIGGLHAYLGHVRTANGTAGTSEFPQHEEEARAERGEEEPQEHRASLNLAAALLVIVGAESDVVAGFVYLKIVLCVRKRIVFGWLNRGGEITHEVGAVHGF